MLARSVAGYLSDKYGTEVRIKTFYVDSKLRVHAEDVMINDKMHYPMLCVDTLDAKINIRLRDIKDEWKVKDLYVSNLLVNLVKYKDDYKLNLSEIFYNQNDDDDGKSNLLKPKIHVDNLKVVESRVVVWDQNKDNPDKVGMDYSHLDIDNINVSLRKLSFDGNAITGYLESLSATEKSGFKIDKFCSDSLFLVSPQELSFSDLKLKSHATDMNLDLYFNYDGFKDFKHFVDSIDIIANIKNSQLTLSDLRFFSKTMEKMPDTLKINGFVKGRVCDFRAQDFSFSFKDSTDFLGDFEMTGLPKFFDTYIDGDITSMNFTYQDLSEFAIPTSSGKIPLPTMLSSVREAALYGKFEGYPRDFTTNFLLRTNIGVVDFEGYLENDLLKVSIPTYSCVVNVDSLDLGQLMSMENSISMSLVSFINGKGMDMDNADLEAGIDISELYYNDNKFYDIAIRGELDKDSVTLHANVDSELIGLDFNGFLNLSDNKQSIRIDSTTISKVDLQGLDLVKNDKRMIFSTNINANIVSKNFMECLNEKNIDQIFGNITLTNTTYTDDSATYKMDNLDLALTTNYFESKNVSLKCDFFDLNINGIFNFKNIDNTFKNYILNYFYVDKLAPKDSTRHSSEKQEFDFNLTTNDNIEELFSLVAPNLRVSDNTMISGTFMSNKYDLDFTLKSDEITYNNMVLNDVYVRNETEKDKNAKLSIDIKDFIFKQKSSDNSVELGMENMKFSADMHDDSLLFDLSWNNEIRKGLNKGNLSAIYMSNENGGRLNIMSDGVIVNDTLWNISDDCYIDFNKNGITFGEFDVYTKNQSIRLKGDLPGTYRDTIWVEFDEFNLSNIDPLTIGYGVDVNGFIDGTLQFYTISDRLTFLSDLDISDVGVNDYVIGDARLDARRNISKSSIFIDAVISGDSVSTPLLELYGNYITSSDVDNLDFNLELNNFDIALVNSFAKGTLSRVEGKLGGDFRVGGTLKNLVLTGEADLKDGACRIDYLNTYYKVNPSDYNYGELSPYIKFTENRIDLQNIILLDTFNQKAVAQSVITHDYFRNFNFNVDAKLNNFMGMNMLPKDGSTFYGTAIASGDLKINGPLEDIKMNINALSNPGTVIDVLLTSTESINDNFIIFVQKENPHEPTTIIPEKKKDKKFTLALNAEVTQDAEVNIHLPSNMGNIKAKGTGNIRLGVSPEQLSLYGDYIINNGTFDFNFQNLVHRTFELKQGGAITWTGRADDADIDVVGSYSTRSSLSSLGVEMDSTSMVNKINVDCILRLQEKLKNPTITLGLSLPNATDDIKNTVFSIIDTTNQAVMSQQVISLLVLNSFSYTSTSLYEIGASNYYNVLTGSLSSWLSQISKKIDIDVSYTPEDDVTAEELEVGLSTHLFNDRLTIEGNLGMFTGLNNEVAGGASSIVGDVDVTLRINNRMSLKGYNHSNTNTNFYTYTYEYNSNYTQGIALSYSFDRLKDIFVRKNKKNKKNKKTNINDDE